MKAQQVNNASVAAIGFILAVVLFAVIGVAAKLLIQPPAIDADRAAERAQALAEIRATEYTNLTTVGWVDQSRGIVRLPIDSAIQLAAQKWQDPSAARADLNDRAEKAAAPAPVAPPKPSAFE